MKEIDGLREMERRVVKDGREEVIGEEREES